MENIADDDLSSVSSLSSSNSGSSNTLLNDPLQSASSPPTTPYLAITQFVYSNLNYIVIIGFIVYFLSSYAVNKLRLYYDDLRSRRLHEEAVKKSQRANRTVGNRGSEAAPGESTGSASYDDSITGGSASSSGFVNYDSNEERMRRARAAQIAAAAVAAEKNAELKAKKEAEELERKKAELKERESNAFFPGVGRRVRSPQNAPTPGTGDNYPRRNYFNRNCGPRGG